MFTLAVSAAVAIINIQGALIGVAEANPCKGTCPIPGTQCVQGGCPEFMNYACCTNCFAGNCCKFKCNHASKWECLEPCRSITTTPVCRGGCPAIGRLCNCRGSFRNPGCCNRANATPRHVLRLDGKEGEDRQLELVGPQCCTFSCVGNRWLCNERCPLNGGWD